MEKFLMENHLCFRVLSPESNPDCKRKTTMKWKTVDPEYNEQVKGVGVCHVCVWLYVCKCGFLNQIIRSFLKSFIKAFI